MVVLIDVLNIGHLFLKWEIIHVQFGKWMKPRGINYFSSRKVIDFIQSVGMVYVKNQETIILEVSLILNV